MATFNAGAIEAKLTLDRSAFTKELSAAQKEAQQFSSTEISPKLQLDENGEFEKLRLEIEKLSEKEIEIKATLTGNAFNEMHYLSQRIRDLSGESVRVGVAIQDHGGFATLRTMIESIDGKKISLDIDLDRAIQTLGELETILGHLNGKDIDLEIKINGEEKLVLLDAAISALDGRDIDIDIDVHGDGAAIAGEGAQMATAEFGRMKAIVLAVIMLLPLVAPAIAVGTAGILGLASGLTAAAGGLGVLALGVGPTVTSMMALREEISKQQTKLQGLKPGTKDYIKTLSKIEESQKAMTEDYGTAGVALGKMGDAYKKFTESVEPQSLLILAQAFGFVEKIMPSLTSIFKAFEPVMTDALKSLNGTVGSPEWDRMMTFFTKYGPSAFKSILSIGGNLVQFLGRLFEAFAPFGDDLLKNIDDLTASWADWADGIGDSKEFKEFIDYVNVEGPKVWELIKSMIAALINLGIALAPMGSIALDGFTKFFDIIANTDPGMLGAIAVTIGVATLAVLGLTAATAAWTAVMALNPIALVVIAIAALAAGLIYAYNNSETFRAGVDKCFNFIQTIVGNVVSVVIELFRKLLVGWTTVVGGLLAGAATVAEKLGLPWAPAMRNASNAFNTTAEVADRVLGGIATSASKWGEDTGKNYAGGVGAGRAPARAMAAAVAGDVKYALNIDSYATGVAVSTGLAGGIRDRSGDAVAAARAMSIAVKDAVAYPLIVRSPSKATFAIGRFVGEGLALGIIRNMDMVVNAADKLGKAAIPSIDASGLGGRTLVKQPSQMQMIANENSKLQGLMATMADASRGNNPLVGGDLVLQAAPNQSVESQFDSVMFRLRTTKGA